MILLKIAFIMAGIMGITLGTISIWFGLKYTSVAETLTPSGKVGLRTNYPLSFPEGISAAAPYIFDESIKGGGNGWKLEKPVGVVGANGGLDYIPHK